MYVNFEYTTNEDVIDTAITELLEFLEITWTTVNTAAISACDC